MTIELSLLGGFRLSFDGLRSGCSSRPTQRLVAFLALQEVPLSRSYVAANIWPDLSEDRALANLRAVLWKTSSLPENPIHDADRRLGLSSEVDLDYRSARVQADRILSTSKHRREADLDVLRFKKDLLPDWYESWLDLERESFRQLRLHTLETICEELTLTHRYAEAAMAALTAIAADPLRETAHRCLIQVFLAEGNIADALRAYLEYRRLLRHELGIAPSDHMERLVSPLTTPNVSADFATLRLDGAFP